MPSLESVKKRITSVNKTLKITNAMKLVATSKIRKQKQQFETTSSFCGSFYDAIAQAIDSVPASVLKPRGNKNAAKSLYIVVTSNLGLCGSYNNAILKKAYNEMGKTDDIIVYGRKGYNFFKSKHLEKQVIEFADIELTNLEYYNVLPTAYKIIELFLGGQYKEVNIAYTKFENSLKFEPTITKMFPTDFNVFRKRIHKTTQQIVVLEPDQKEVLDAITPLYAATTIYGALVESCLCENSSRRNTMDGATKNADDLIEALKIQYNRLRQESITKEISEIVAGANFKQQGE